MTESLSSESSYTPLLDILVSKAIPWIEQGGMQRVVIARPARADLVLPPGVHVSQKKLVSRPTSIRSRRVSGSTSRSTVQWVEDDQETTLVSSLICVVSGQADLQMGDYVLHCPAGTFVFVSAGMPHPRGERSHLEGKNRLCGSCDLLWLSPRGRQVQCWMCYSRAEAHIVPRGRENVFLLNERILHYLNNLEEEAAGQEPDHEKMCHYSLNMLLVAVHRDLQAGRFLQRLQEASESVREKGQDPIVMAENYIRSYLATPLTIEKVASAVFMSQTHFRRRFQERTGCTFTAYINKQRLAQAQRYLRETDWSVNQVGEFIGFRSPAHFHTLFRRRFDMSPNEFRLKSQRELENQTTVSTIRRAGRKSGNGQKEKL